MPICSFQPLAQTTDHRRHIAQVRGPARTRHPSRGCSRRVVCRARRPTDRQQTTGPAKAASALGRPRGETACPPIHCRGAQPANGASSCPRRAPARAPVQTTSAAIPGVAAEGREHAPGGSAQHNTAAGRPCAHGPRQVRGDCPGRTTCRATRGRQRASRMRGPRPQAHPSWRLGRDNNTSRVLQLAANEPSRYGVCLLVGCGALGRCRLPASPPTRPYSSSALRMGPWHARHRQFLGSLLSQRPAHAPQDRSSHGRHRAPYNTPLQGRACACCAMFSCPSH